MVRYTFAGNMRFVVMKLQRRIADLEYALELSHKDAESGSKSQQGKD